MNAEQRAEVRARIEAATPGPWAALVGKVTIFVTTPDQDVAVVWDAGLYGDEEDAAAALDAEFIAHSRADLPAALDAIDRVLALHAPHTIGSRTVCVRCRADQRRPDWPCEVVRAIEGAS